MIELGAMDALRGSSGKPRPTTVETADLFTTHDLWGDLQKPFEKWLECHLDYAFWYRR
jgi:hypothetical protein